MFGDAMVPRRREEEHGMVFDGCVVSHCLVFYMF
jgi:hypothetical protein